MPIEEPPFNGRLDKWAEASVEYNSGENPLCTTDPGIDFVPVKFI